MAANPPWRKKISMTKKVALARRCGVPEDGRPHLVLCPYCNTPGRVTLWPKGTFKVWGGWVGTSFLDMKQERIIAPHAGVTTTMAIDHVVPLKAGGTNDVDNMVFACNPCNASKCAHPLDEWKGRR